MKNISEDVKRLCVPSGQPAPRCSVCGADMSLNGRAWICAWCDERKSLAARGLRLVEEGKEYRRQIDELSAQLNSRQECCFESTMECKTARMMLAKIGGVMRGRSAMYRGTCEDCREANHECCCC